MSAPTAIDLEGGDWRAGNGEEVHEDEEEQEDQDEDKDEDGDRDEEICPSPTKCWKSAQVLRA